MGITDAFEGLNPAAAGQGYTEPTKYDSMPPSLPSMGFNTLNSSQEPVIETITEPEKPSQSAYIPPAPVPPPKSTEQLAASYKMGDDSDELKKLKATLQRLQAENIALRAQMGSMSEEERSVQKEAAATISEIARLSAELSEVRAQVLSTKSRLMESTAELTAAKEKKA
jgi:predicted RNase H-like nuclease (RuvC/YqgF family)